MRRTFRTTAAVCAVLVVAACGTGSGPAGPDTSATGSSGGTTRTAPTTPPTTPPDAGPTTAATTATPGASAQLARFFRVVVAADARVRAVARRVNQDIGTDVIDPSAAADRAVTRLDVTDVARAVPAGTPAELQRSALGLYANLVSRRSSLVRFTEYSGNGPLPRTSEEARDILGCLRNGATPAANFAADLAAARRLAARTPAFVVRAPSSRAAADVAIRAAYVDIANGGCDTCGGYAPRPGPSLRVVWGEVPGWDDVTFDGRVGPASTIDELGGIAFTARYRQGTGWRVELNAC